MIWAQCLLWALAVVLHRARHTLIAIGLIGAGVCLEPFTFAVIVLVSYLFGRRPELHLDVLKTDVKLKA